MTGIYLLFYRGSSSGGLAVDNLPCVLYLRPSPLVIYSGLGFLYLRTLTGTKRAQGGHNGCEIAMETYLFLGSYFSPSWGFTFFAVFKRGRDGEAGYEAQVSCEGSVAGKSPLEGDKSGLRCNTR